ncbi:flagellar motor protein MotB [Chitinimonas sp. BJB300]|uniref:flagellar motor protein MotB n=1 Tax=Chitinimonas sp. BJB300 TaxID=1559339 RepID=UPI000C118606|nr:flagellar motor protein MotB [Chitinimonas sp. BJB300]PHV13116.1 motility protein MotB [Chitinimonas sp. BJB300]TSJ84713.1 flagellar motor protein MotB [Chitinimonas sp. BJB300]
MSDDSQRPIIVKKIKKGGHGHHGGAWKIAYADFVTAMMAFFLLMWLLGSATKGDLRGIADYFQNPLKVALSGGSGAGESNSVMQGGGLDLSKKAGAHRRSPDPGDKKILDQLKKKLEEALKSSATGKLAQYKDQILLDITPEGLRIQIVDQQNRPMFKSGSEQMEGYAADILKEIAAILNEVPNRLSLSGHTDSAGFSGGDANFSNWELSADRANSSRRQLITGGLGGAKILRVVGLADSVPFDTANPANPVNRRISIIVLNKEAEENIMKLAGKAAGETENVGDAETAAAAINEAVGPGAAKP